MSERENEPLEMTARRIPIVTHEMTAAACDAFMGMMQQLREELQPVEGDPEAGAELIYRSMREAIGAALDAKPTEEESNEFARELMLQVAQSQGAICGCPCGCEVPLKDKNAMQLEMPLPAGMELPEGASAMMTMVCLDCYGGAHPAKAGDEWKGPTR